MSNKRETIVFQTEQMEQQKISEMIEPLLQWYDKNRRILPWREEPSPYRVWVSEIMLQQTRVEAGREYFERFMKELPDIESLANVEDEKLMKLWEGLGYYNRARNLKKAAGIVIEKFSGRMPSAYAQLLELPGIGPYTAGAIASIAFGEVVPAVDGNVLRVLSRITADHRDITASSVKKSMQSKLQEIIPRKRTGDFNQALMELGALVCIPNGAPKCAECPVNEFCIALKKNLTAILPFKKLKKPRKIEQKTMLIMKLNGEMALRKRPDTGLLAGFFELPSIPQNLEKEEVALCLSEMGFAYTSINPLGEAKHIFSHVEWRMKGYEIKLIKLPEKSQEKNNLFCLEDSSEPDFCMKGLDDLIWVKGEILREKIALPSAFKPYENAFPKREEGGE